MNIYEYKDKDGKRYLFLKKINIEAQRKRGIHYIGIFETSIVVPCEHELE
jgi:hypothetical protein